jgi:hypothetical protein
MLKIKHHTLSIWGDIVSKEFVNNPGILRNVVYYYSVNFVASRKIDHLLATDDL